MWDNTKEISQLERQLLPLHCYTSGSVLVRRLGGGSKLLDQVKRTDQP